MKELFISLFIIAITLSAQAQSQPDTIKHKELKEVTIRAWQRRDITRLPEEQNGFLNTGKKNEVVNLDNKFILSCNWVFKDNSLGTMVIEAPLLSNSYSEKML